MVLSSQAASLNQLRYLKQLLRDRGELLDHNCLLPLLFSFTGWRLKGTRFGATAEQVFAHLGKELSTAAERRFEGIEWGQCDESVLGHIYQLAGDSDRIESQQRVQQPNKNTILADMIAFTQLYTPDWVARILLETAVPPDSRPFARILDPSCGAGNFLLPAVDLIYSARLKLEKPSQAMTAALTQVSGCDIDSLGLFVCALSLTLKASEHLPLADIPKLRLQNVLECDQSPLGSLRRDIAGDSLLNDRYDAVVGNPPYLGRKLLDRRLKEKLKKAYPKSHQDLCTAFIERGLELLNPSGKLAYITQASLLYLPTFGGLRQLILDRHRIDTVIEAGPHVFPMQSGEKVNSVLLVIQEGQSNPSPSRFLNVTAHSEKQAAIALAFDGDSFITKEQDSFRSFRRNAFNYDCPTAFQIIKDCHQKLSEQADIRQGLATTDNARFVKWWWQVPARDIGSRWFPYAKGGGGERWFKPIDTVVNWEDDGSEIKRTVSETYPYLNGKTEWVVKNEQYYFREGLTFSFVNSKGLAVRWLPDGCIFDVGGSALFVQEQELHALLAYLNSSFIASCAKSLNPTINFQVGDLKELPFLNCQKSESVALATYARECIDIKTWLSAFLETARNANAPVKFSEQRPESVIAQATAKIERLTAAEQSIDDLVLNSLTRTAQLDAETARDLRRVCGLAARDRKLVNNPIETAEQFAYRWLNALLLSKSSIELPLSNDESVRTALNLTDHQIHWMKQATGEPVKDYLAGRFMTQHLKAHHGYPRLAVESQESLLRLTQVASDT